MLMKKTKQKNCNQVIGTMKVLTLSVLCNSLFTICKSFDCLNLDHADIAYDIQGDLDLEQNQNKVQCKASLAIMGVIKGACWRNLYHEVEFKSLSVK